MNDANKELNLIIKGDVQGSIEAIKGSLENWNWYQPCSCITINYYCF
jgi:translation initiation factor IF-2